MVTHAPQLEHVKQLMKSMWTSGDFAAVAQHMQDSADAFVGRLKLKPGMRVLDVGCGSGNQSIPAARTGAQVAAVDIAPNLLAHASERAKRGGLNIDFREGDAEALPFGEGEFDVVMSVFAAIFAPRPEMVVSEFVRVCRPGGLIAMGNWPHDSFIAKQTAIMTRFVPLPPGAPNAMDWGEERVVKERFGSRAEVNTVRRELIFNLPFGPEQSEEHFRRNLGPAQVVLSRLDGSGKQQLIDALRELWVRENRGDANHTVIPTEYLEVHARPRRGN